MNSYVYALAVSGNDLYAGGEFTTAGGSGIHAIARWDGTNWTSLGAGVATPGTSSALFALTISGNDLYVGGGFLTAGGGVCAEVARFLLPLPRLSVLHSGANVTLSWPSASSNLGLEQSDNFTVSGSWLPNSAPMIDDGTNRSVTLPATNASQFFRLRRP